jgi:hypothetical protein
MFAPTSARAQTSPEARSVQLINEERVERGLRTLTRRSDLDAIAERHSERMRNEADIWHNPNLANEIPGSWQSGGENVGVGFDVDGLHAAFMGSHDHRANILKSVFDEVGLGVVVDPSGEVYITQVFVDRGAPAAPKPAAKPKPKPKPVAEPRPESEEPTPAVNRPATKSSVRSKSATTSAATPSEPRVRRSRVDRAGAVQLLIRIVRVT